MIKNKEINELIELENELTFTAMYGIDIDILEIKESMIYLSLRDRYTQKIKKSRVRVFKNDMIRALKAICKNITVGIDNSKNKLSYEDISFIDRVRESSNL